MISLYRDEEDPQPIRALDDDSRPLGYYSITNLQTLKVGYSWRNHDITPRWAAYLMSALT